MFAIRSFPAAGVVALLASVAPAQTSTALTSPGKLSQGMDALDALPAVRAAGVRSTRMVIAASRCRRNRRVTGAVTDWVQGVPSSPVDSMVWDGNGSDPIPGRIVIDVDPVNNTGFLQADWVDEYGVWSYRQNRFVHPEHASGARLGLSVGEVELVILDPVVTNVYLHGDTTAGPPVLPTVFASLAAWGPAAVTLNGQLFQNQIDGPFRPKWDGHLMVTDGVRMPDGTVRTFVGGIFDMTHAQDGLRDPTDIEVHLTFHDIRFPMNMNNIPPLFDFFYHLVFEDVVIQIRHVEGSTGS